MGSCPGATSLDQRPTRRLEVQEAVLECRCRYGIGQRQDLSRCLERPSRSCFRPPVSRWTSTHSCSESAFPGGSDARIRRSPGTASGRPLQPPYRRDNGGIEAAAGAAPDQRTPELAEETTAARTSGQLARAPAFVRPLVFVQQVLKAIEEALMARGGVVISHWHALIDQFNTSTLDFYSNLEGAVRAREVPEAEFSRVEFKEGGFGSAKRIYLRVERGKVAFDVGAAPYGTGYFFSWWMSRLGPKHPFLYLLGFLAALFIGTPLLTLPFRNSCSYFFMFPLVFIGIIVGLAALARNEVFGPEEDILAIPVLGWLYEKVFNPITYYSLDTALMFQESVRRAVNETIDGLLSGQGLRALTEEQKKPTIRDLAR